MYRPYIHDFFPSTRRGHGSTHPEARFDRERHVQTRNGCRCVNGACSLLRRQDDTGKTLRGEAHIDPATNAKEWKEERGFHPDDSLEMCVFGVRRMIPLVSELVRR